MISLLKKRSQDQPSTIDASSLTSLIVEPELMYKLFDDVVGDLDALIESL